MKKLFAIAFILFATSSFAQTLTPDMLVGEYKGEVQVLYNQSTEPMKEKTYDIKISKIENSDSLKFDIDIDGAPYNTKLFIDNDKVIAYSKSIVKRSNYVKTNTIKNYEGDKITSQEFGSFDPKKNEFIISLSSETTVSNSDHFSRKYLYLSLKKK